MHILFIGDIVGQPGRKIVKEKLPGLRSGRAYDMVIANCENATHGKGVSALHAEQLLSYGIDFLTGGNHVWKYKDVYPKMDSNNFPMIRPYNYPPGVPGKGYKIVEIGLLKKVAVVNLIGRVFFPADYDCPFRAIDRILGELRAENPQAIIVDFHAEATSEKIAFAHYVDGRVTAVIGTHTHVPTADAKILEKGTAYITDVGMAGLKDSVIGVKKENVIKSFLTQLPTVHEIGEGVKILNAVELEINDEGKAESISLVYIEME